MIVRTGITSFFRRNKLPEFIFDDFKRIVYTCAVQSGFVINDLFKRGVTPNFHTAVFEGYGDCVHVLGHSNFPIIAFAEPRVLSSNELIFRDMDRIANPMKQMFPNVTIASQEELSRPITKTDLLQLDRAEIMQVKYWKPATIGELAFNWWD